MDNTFDHYFHDNRHQTTLHFFDHKTHLYLSVTYTRIQYFNFSIRHKMADRKVHRLRLVMTLQFHPFEIIQQPIPSLKIKKTLFLTNQVVLFLMTFSMPCFGELYF